MTRLQRYSLTLATAAVLLWYGVIATSSRGVWLAVTIAVSAVAFVACTAVLVQAWRAQ